MEEKKQKAGKRPLAGSGGGLSYDWCTTNCPTNNIFTHPLQSDDAQLQLKMQIWIQMLGVVSSQVILVLDRDGPANDYGVP